MHRTPFGRTWVRLAGRRAAALVALAASLAAPATRAATIVVETTAIGGDPASQLCDLAEALDAAFADQVRGGCPAGSGFDVVDLSGLSGTIRFAGTLAVFADVIIHGPGADQLTLDGPIRIQAKTATLEGVTVTTGGITTGGGGIVFFGDAELRDCRVTGTLDSTIRVFSGAHVVIRRCLIDGNHGFHAAIYNQDSTLEISDSTLSGNGEPFCLIPCGGIVSQGSSAETLVRNCTFRRNGVSPGANLVNSGGARTTVSHTVLGAGPGRANCAHDRASEPIASAGYNLSDDASCGFAMEGDRNATPTGLGPLATNGGPTPTHMLVAGSAAIDGGDPSGCTDAGGAPLTIDQRGAPRPIDANGDGIAECDIGAIEVPEPGAAGSAAAALAALAALARGRSH